MVGIKKPSLARRLFIFKSGRSDSNTRPPAPKAGALTGLRYAPNILKYCGEGGIRTLGTVLPVRQFSKLLISASHPPHQCKELFSIPCFIAPWG